MFGQDFTHPRSWCIMKEKISFILLERIRNFLTFLLLLSFSFRIKTINSPVSISFFFPFCFLFAKHVGISGNLISELLIAGCCLLSSRCFYLVLIFFSSHQILSISFSLLTTRAWMRVRIMGGQNDDGLWLRRRKKERLRELKSPRLWSISPQFFVWLARNTHLCKE